MVLLAGLTFRVRNLTLVFILLVGAFAMDREMNRDLQYVGITKHTRILVQTGLRILQMGILTESLFFLSMIIPFFLVSPFIDPTLTTIGVTQLTIVNTYLLALTGLIVLISLDNTLPLMYLTAPDHLFSDLLATDSNALSIYLSETISYCTYLTVTCLHWSHVVAAISVPFAI
jgi:hypothetical protein